ncbi:MAG: S-adenosylmethionine:tRNA ribosyltransferase-isomerase [Firmicutes bacterium]|nr:S-adenosylmethionine:tRNA ribosyltransferase-isomerase [Bacillota bacterium]
MLHPYPLDLGLLVPPAVRPPEDRGLTRDAVKLLAIDSHSGQFRDHPFQDIVDLLNPGDVLVVNNSATIPAALDATVANIPHRLHLAARLASRRVLVELRSASGAPDRTALSPGQPVHVRDNRGCTWGKGVVVEPFHPKSRLWAIDCDQDWYAGALKHGRPIRYRYVARPYPIETYHTVFGCIPGSSEMPSASRPFTPAIVDRLVKKGVAVAPLTLHATVSSHEVEDPLDLPLIPEWYDIPGETQSLVEAAHRAHRPIVALGTTVVRALETWASGLPPRGWTTHLVTPDAPPQIVTSLITGLHDSFTSHLWLLYAFLDPGVLKRAYHHAAERGYLWHEFGDVSLIR